jgi:prepilin-type N-terminal cleavage/methylation domain-containing protein
MKKHHIKESGFSAIELLITLFIAAAFLLTGYQLYGIIIEDGGDARVQAKASNIAYDNLRKYTPNASNPCATYTPSPQPSVPSGSLPSPSSITVNITCPSGVGTTSVSKVQVTVKYGTKSPQEEVVHAIFVTE